MNTSQKAALSVVLSGVLWGIINIFVKTLSAAGIGPLEISAIRMVCAAVLFTAFLLIRDRSKLKIELRDLWMFVGTGIVSVVLFNVCYFYTMINSQASVAVVLLYTSPAFIMLLSALIFRERITVRSLAALVLTFSGCVLVAGVFGGGYSIPPTVLAAGLSSGLFYALYTIFGRFALKKYDTMTVTAYTFIFGMIGSLPLGNIGGVIGIVSAQPVLILWCVGIGVFCTVLPYFFYTWGLERMASGKAAILAAVEPIVGAVIGMTAFHESRSAAKLVGIALVIAAIIILNLNGKEKNA